jgi:hypothetical protein
MVQWAPDDTYAQAHGNKPKYVGHVRGVNKNILPGQGNSCSYHTLSQARAQNLRSSTVISQIIEKALEAKSEQHMAQMARERKEITTQVTT